MTTVIARRDEAKTLADGTYLEAEAKLYSLGDQRPYFSTTATLWKSKGYAQNTRPDHAIIGLGAMTEEIARHFPELAPVVALHLSYDDGAPMHAVDNGWYWYGGATVDGSSEFARMTPHDRTAHHLRIDPAELPEGLTREQFSAFVETLRPRWKAEADKAREILEQAS